MNRIDHLVRKHYVWRATEAARLKAEKEKARREEKKNERKV